MGTQMETQETKMLSFGTNRLVIVGKDYVYKLPIGRFGKRANLQEYLYSQERSYVAHTERHWYGLKQEKLHDLITLPLGEEPPIELQELFRKKLTNRFQVGRNKLNQWKYFDYEDIKYYCKGR